MPLVKVEIYKGMSEVYKRTLLDCIHNALVKSFGIPIDDRLQSLYELDKSNFLTDDSKSEKYTLIELTIFKGRSLDAKRLLYKEITDSLFKNLGIRGNDILIVINEQPLDNWGLRGGISATDLDLGFKIDV